MAVKTPIRASELVQRFPNLFAEIIGDGACSIRGVGAPETAGSEEAVFLATPKALAQGLASAAAVIVVNKNNRAEAEARRDGKTILVSPNVELAMATVINEFFLQTPYTSATVQGVHRTAIIGAGAELGADVRVGPHAVIGARVKLGRGVFVGANAVVEDDCEIGEGSVLHPLVYIGHHTSMGRRCEIHPCSVIGKEGFGYVRDGMASRKIPHQGRVVLGDDVHIGGNVTIDRATFGETRIGEGTKFDNQIHFAHNCSVGKHSLITAGFNVAGSTSIGDGFMCGGNTSVGGHISIADNVHLAGLSVVSKSVSEPGRYGGSPLQTLQQFLKTKSSLAHVVKMRKQLKQVLEKLGIEDSPAEEETVE